MEKEYSYIDFRKNPGREEILCYYWQDEKRECDVFQNPHYFLYIPENASSFGYKTEPGFVSIDGKKLKRVYPKHKLETEEYHNWRGLFLARYESDVPYITRWMWETKPRISKKPRILFFDIETTRNRDGYYSSPEIADGQVVSISFNDSFEGKTRAMLFHPSKTVPDAECFKTERALITRFCEIVSGINPDYFSGWNVEKYDLVYSINRIERLQAKHSCILSPFGADGVYVDKNGNPRIKGRGIFDLMAAARKLKISEERGYSLNEVSKKVLGRKKLDVGSIDEAWKNNPEKLVEYNMNDVDLCVEIDKKARISEVFASFSDIVSLNLNAPLSISAVIYSYLKEKFNCVLFDSNEKTMPKLEGGHVFESETGVYENVVFLDAVSMYPSQIRTFNISPDTVDFSKLPESYNIGNEYFFHKDFPGFITRMIDEVFAARLKAKREKNYPLSTALKLLMNSTYGAMAFKWSRIPSIDCASAITRSSRDLIKFIALKLEENGLKIFGGDTDSVMIFFGKCEDLEERMAKIEQESVVWLGEFAEKCGVKQHYWKLEFDSEKKFRRFVIFGKKKKYAGIGFDDKLYFTGIEYKRSDSAQITQEFQYSLIESILRNPGFSIKDGLALKEKYKVEIEKICFSPKSRADLMRIAIPSRISKRATEYKNNFICARAIKNSGIKVSPGEIFYMLYANGDIVAFKSLDELPESVSVSFTKMFNRCIENKWKLFEPLFISQSKLGDFA